MRLRAFCYARGCSARRFCSFVEKGYLRTSTLDIATRARASKRELYAVCADKQGLLREAIAERAKRMRLSLDLPPAESIEALQRVLTEFATATLRGVCEPQVLGVFRLAIAESINSPDVAKTLDASRQENRAALVRTLQAAQKGDLIGPIDPAAMINDFLGLLWGDLLLRLLLRTAEAPSLRTIEKMAKRAVQSFLRLHGRNAS
jgi:AcrR family transcriptional regulator